MLEFGFITMERKLTSWEWYKNQNVKSIFLHLILTANYEDVKWQGQIIKRGQRVASYHTLADESGLTVMQVRNAINKLILTQEVTRSPTANYTVFTVVNYEKYQDIQQGKQRTSNKRITNGEQTDNNNVTNITNITKKEQKNGVPPERKTDAYVAKRKF